MPSAADKSMIDLQQYNAIFLPWSNNVGSPHNTTLGNYGMPWFEVISTYNLTALHITVFHHSGVF